MQCTRHATTKLFQYITYCHFCWINCSTVQDNTIQQRHNMSGRTTTECLHKSWKLHRLETSWNYILNRINILDHVHFVHACTNTLHYMWDIQETSGSKSNYRGEQVLGTGHCSVLSERLWRKPTDELEGSTEQQSAAPLKWFYLHIKLHKISFSELITLLSN